MLRSLKNKRIIFMDQITSIDESYLLLYNEVKEINATNYKGPKPNWFKSLEDTAILSDFNRKLLTPITKPMIQPVNQKTPKISTNNRFHRPKNEWSIHWNGENNSPIYGKTIEQVNNQGSISISYIEHYIPHIHPNEITTNLTPRKRTAILQLCRGCSLHTPYHRDLRPKCVIMSRTTSLYLFKIHNNKYTPPQRLTFPRKHKFIFPTVPLLTLTTKAYNLFHNNHHHHSLQLTTEHTDHFPLVNNHNAIPNNKYFLEKILQGSSTQINLLLKLAHSFSNLDQFTFYTDGSLTGLQTSSCRMGFGWIEPHYNVTFKGSCILNPSSTKSESYAILTALLTLPNNSTVNIYTDSQNCIHNYNNFSNPLLSRRKQLNHNNHLLWTFIMEIIKDKGLKLTLHKVKAHSNNIYNDMVDELATQGLNIEPINLNIKAHAINSLLLPIWNSMGIIDTNHRKWMNKLLQARIFNNFIFNTDFNTLRNVFSNIDINWEYTSLWTKKNDKAEEITSFKHTRNCSYKIKSISHQLPTGDIQSQNYPLLYKNLTPIICPNCQEDTDNNSHLGKCHKTKVEINQIFKEAKDLLIQLMHDSTDTYSYLVKDSITSLECLKEINLDALDIPDSHYIYLWAHNIIPNELILFLHSHINTKRQVQQILWQFLDIFMKKIRKITWINRCKLMKQWEKNNNIIPKDKKLYKRLNNKQHSTRSQNSRQHRTTKNINNNSLTSNGQEDTCDFDPHNSSLFRYYNVHRGKKRKLDNTPLLNNYHLTDWILYTSSNFLHGGHWTNYISSFNFSLLSYYSSIEFYNFYRKFLFLDFSLYTLGLDKDTGHVSNHR
jgi:ribonuclease HI